MFEITKTTGKLGTAVTLPTSFCGWQLMILYFLIKFFAEIVRNTINFCNFGNSYYKGYFYVIYLVISYKYTKNSPYSIIKSTTSYIELTLLK